MGIYAGLYVGISQYNKLGPRKGVTFESVEQENFVKRYIKHAEIQAHKPVLLREAFKA